MVFASVLVGAQEGGGENEDGHGHDETAQGRQGDGEALQPRPRAIHDLEESK